MSINCDTKNVPFLATEKAYNAMSWQQFRAPLNDRAYFRQPWSNFLGLALDMTRVIK